MGPEAVAGDDEDVSAMAQAVQSSRGQQGISEEIRPLFRRAVAGEHNAALFVALIDDVVKVLRAWGMQGLEPEVIQHQQVGTKVGLETTFQGGGNARPSKVILEQSAGRQRLGQRETGLATGRRSLEDRTSPGAGTA